MLSPQGVLAEQLPQNIVRTAQNTDKVDDQEVTVLCQEYDDRTLVLVTQVGKVNPGEQTAEFLNNKGRQDTIRVPTVSLVPLFGTPPNEMGDLYALYATQIAAKICADLYTADTMMGPMKPVVVGLALSPSTDNEDLAKEKNRLDTVLALVEKSRVW